LRVNNPGVEALSIKVQLRPGRGGGGAGVGVILATARRDMEWRLVSFEDWVPFIKNLSEIVTQSISHSANPLAPFTSSKTMLLGTERKGQKKKEQKKKGQKKKGQKKKDQKRKGPEKKKARKKKARKKRARKKRARKKMRASPSTEALVCHSSPHSSWTPRP
jgi:hypothetical protein